MKSIHTIRNMTHDDLAAVYALGLETPPSSLVYPWDAGAIADVLCEGLELSFVSVIRKKVTGFIIARQDGESTARACWFGTAEKFRGSGLEERIIRSFLDYLRDKHIETVNFDLSDNDNYRRDILETCGFSEKAGTITMGLSL